MEHLVTSMTVLKLQLTRSLQVFDGELYGDTVTITIIINPINDAPLTESDTISLDEVEQ